jgi:hypothetical protein
MKYRTDKPIKEPPLYRQLCIQLHGCIELEYADRLYWYFQEGRLSLSREL